MYSFDRQTVLVSGGTSGIGAAIAEGFRNAGATVHALGLETGLNVADPKTIEAALSNIDQLDILVNAAGVIRRLRH